VQLSQLSVENAKNALWQQELTRDSDVKKKNDAKTQVQKDAYPSNDQEDAAINSKDYDVAIAQANLQDAQSAHGNVSAIASAQQAVVSAQADLDDLLNGGNVNDVKQAKANLQQAQAALDLARSNLTKTTLVAPFDGIVAQINLHPGAQTPNGAAVIMLDTGSYYVDIAVDETDVAKLALDQPTSLTLDALPGVTVNGKVARIGDTGTKTGDVVAYPVRIQIDPAGQPLRTSMSTTATVTTSIVKDAVRVRNRFVRLNRSTGKATVQLRQPDGTYKEVEITLGIRNDTYSEVKSGLKPGDTIAILPASTTFGPANG
jgi:HlyD family secretion protein